MDIRSQVKDKTPDAIISLIEKQMVRAKNASDRIEKEGEVVRDVKGSVIPHPAIKIEQDATKLACDLLAKHRR